MCNFLAYAGPLNTSLGLSRTSEPLHAHLGKGSLHGLPPEVDDHPVRELPQSVSNEAVGVDEVRLASWQMVRVEVPTLDPRKPILTWTRLPNRRW